jgi:hypothetical protein
VFRRGVLLSLRSSDEELFPYRKANFDGMRDCATVLQDFNGGASVIALFVNQHQFFIDDWRLDSTPGSSASGSASFSHDSGSPPTSSVTSWSLTISTARLTSMV